MFNEFDQEELDDLYQSMVLQHSRNPQNFGKIECNCSSKGKNPSCGDHLEFFLNIENSIIKDISFIGEGCALSVSSASILSNKIKGKTIAEATEVLNKFSLFIIENETLDDKFEPLHIFSGVKSFPLRVKCVMLSFRTIENAIKEFQHE